MRLMEVGTKQLGRGNKTEAEDLFKKSYDLYSLFWGINLKLINLEGVKQIANDEISVSIGSEKNEPFSEEMKSDKLKEDTGGKGGFGKLGEVVKRIIDCCIE
jgi:hypothetical protein